ncbi:MAG: glycosyl hydrolase, partial [Betaproteobacteria bacterium]
MSRRPGHEQPGLSRRAVALALVLGAAARSVRATEPRPAPAVLREPALPTAHAVDAAMLALARAGSRIVAAGERGLVLHSDDGGRAWTQAHVPVQVSLTALRFV